MKPYPHGMDAQWASWAELLQLGRPKVFCPDSSQALASREELHAQYARSLQDKDELRKRARELGERADELQLQLFQCEARLLAAQAHGRLGQRQDQDRLVLVGGQGCGTGGLPTQSCGLGHRLPRTVPCPSAPGNQSPLWPELRPGGHLTPKLPGGQPGTHKLGGRLGHRNKGTVGWACHDPISLSYPPSSCFPRT